jgi:ABC-type bacteriocin/lantibiotic exporter with double-glycine peptidase domain
MNRTPNLSETAGLFFQLFRLIKPYHRQIAKGVLVGPIIGLLSIVPPYFTKLLFDRVADNHDFNLLLLLVAGIVAFSIASAISEAVLQYYSSYLNIKLENVTQLLFFNHIQHLPFSFFYSRQVGEISSRFQETKSALSSIHAFINVVIGQGVFLLLVPPFLFLLNWKLALVALLAVPFSATAIYLMSSRLRSSWQKVIESHADIEASQLEMLNQIVTIKVLQLERPLYRKLSSKLTNVLGAHLHAQGASACLVVFDKAINLLNVGLFTWLGWSFILDGEMSVGDYVAFSAYVGYLRNPMMEMVNLFANFQQWAIHLKRIFEYLNLEPEQDPNLVGVPVLRPDSAVFEKRIKLNDVSYRYQDNHFALTGVSLEINRGDIVAIIGGSGSGKSTLLRLLTRIEQGYAGEILFDERLIESITLHELRSQMGVVWQEVELFQGTLRENLTIGSESVDQAWLEEIVELCKLADLVDSLPLAYETVVSERGVTLSGGQRQRVALARALIRRAPILILDEAMSNLDIETEIDIVNNLIAHSRRTGQTVLFATHRIATASLADRIYLFDSGRVVDYGSHQALIAGSAVYQKLHRLSESAVAHE